MPVVADFLNRMRDALPSLVREDRSDEAQAISRVLELRRLAASASSRVQLELESIEELFSFASAGGGPTNDSDVIRAICATLEFSRREGRHEQIKLEVKLPGGDWRLPLGWARNEVQRHGGARREFFMIPVVDAFAGLLSGCFNERSEESIDSVITFNYDDSLEQGLRRLGKSYDYENAFAPAEGVVCIAKLHGSVNWARKPKGFEAVEDYDSVCEAGGVPLLIPPTSNKDLGPALASVWANATQMLSTATRVIIIGYSAPSTDSHFKYLLAAGLQNNISLRQLYVVDPAVEGVQQRLEGILASSFASSRQFIPLHTGLAGLLASRADSGNMANIGRAATVYLPELA